VLGQNIVKGHELRQTDKFFYFYHILFPNDNTSIMSELFNNKKKNANEQKN